MLRRHFPSSFFFVSLNSICRVGIFRLRFWRGSVSGRCYQLKSAGNWRQSNRSLQNVRIKIFDWRRRRRRRRRRWRRRRRRRQERKRERRVGNVWCRTKVMVLTRPLSRALLSNWLILRMSAVNGRWARFHGCGRAGIGAGFRLRGTAHKRLATIVRFSHSMEDAVHAFTAFRTCTESFLWPVLNQFDMIVAAAVDWIAPFRHICLDLIPFWRLLFSFIGGFDECIWIEICDLSFEIALYHWMRE